MKTNTILSEIFLGWLFLITICCSGSHIEIEHIYENDKDLDVVDEYCKSDDDFLCENENDESFDNACFETNEDDLLSFEEFITNRNCEMNSDCEAYQYCYKKANSLSGICLQTCIPGINCPPGLCGEGCPPGYECPCCENSICSIEEIELVSTCKKRCYSWKDCNSLTEVCLHETLPLDGTNNEGRCIPLSQSGKQCPKGYFISGDGGECFPGHDDTCIHGCPNGTACKNGNCMIMCPEICSGLAYCTIQTSPLCNKNVICNIPSAICYGGLNRNPCCGNYVCCKVPTITFDVYGMCVEQQKCDKNDIFQFLRRNE